MNNHNVKKWQVDSLSGEGGADNSDFAKNIPKHYTKTSLLELKFLEYSNFLLWSWARHTLYKLQHPNL